MADPATMAITSTVLGGAGAGISAYGALTKGAADSAMYGYQQGIAQINQKIQKQNADYAIATGEVEAQQSGMKTAGQVSQTKVQQSASGLDVNSGSNVTVRDSETAIGQQNQDIIRSSAARKAYGFEVEGAQAEAQGNIYGMAAKTSQTAGILGAVSSIIGGAGSVASKWAQYGSTFGKGTSLYGASSGSAAP